MILAFFVAMAITGCENDIDLKADDTTGLLCINGNLVAGADDNSISVALTGKKEVTYVSNAKVVVSVNGSEVESFEGRSLIGNDDAYYNLTNYGAYPIRAKFNPGDHVQIDVYYGEQHASAGGVVPQPVKDASVKVGYEENVPYKRDMWSESYSFADMATMAVTISDADPANKNFFRMATSQSDTIKMRIDENEQYLNPRSFHLQSASSGLSSGVDVKDGYECWGYYDNYDKYGYYFDNDPILSAEVVKSQGDISFVDAVDNVYKIFNDNFFNGSKATLNVMRTVRLHWDMNDYKPEKYFYRQDKWNPLLHDISYYAPRYTHRNHVDIYSITEDEYYYLKVLNARGPDSYYEYDSDFSLTGDVKLPSNVKGGTGNIFLSSCVRISGCMFEDYVPEYGGEPDNYYYYADEDGGY